MSDSTAGIFSAHAFRESMDRSGWNGREASKQLGLDATTISRLRTGKKTPSMQVLTRIASRFNRPVADFLDLPPSSQWGLLHYRLAAGLTQSAVAEHLGIGPSAVSKWELRRSRPTENTVTNLAALYGTTPNELRHAIDRAHDSPTEQLLALADAVRALAQIGAHATLQEPDIAKRKQTLTDIRSRIIQTLTMLNAAIPQLENDTLTRAKQIVDQLAQILSDTIDS